MKRLLAPIWIHLPYVLRQMVIRMSQDTFTVGVSAVLINGSGEVLLLRHRFRDNVGWELPGGFVAHGERLEEAIRRELKEETGYDVEIVSLLSAFFPRARHVEVCYSTRPVRGELRIQGAEILEGQFFGSESLPDDLPAEHQRNIQMALESFSYSNGVGSRSFSGLHAKSRTPQ